MNYWLSPQGEVYQMQDLGRHTEVAYNIIKAKYPENCDINGIYRDHDGNRDAIEFLENKGYIRYVDWGSNPQWAIYHSNRPTKKQKDMMFELTGFYFDK